METIANPSGAAGKDNDNDKKKKDKSAKKEKRKAGSKSSQRTELNSELSLS